MTGNYIPQGDPTYFLSSFLWSIVFITGLLIIFYSFLSKPLDQLKLFYGEIENLQKMNEELIENQAKLQGIIKMKHHHLIHLKNKYNLDKSSSIGSGAYNSFLTYKRDREKQQVNNIKTTLLNLYQGDFLNHLITS